ncbi:putative conserved transmembrane protein [Mycobacterium kansasii 824]|nr:putative conserved transmembrane protein [Mycobacterium kansasii 824]
MAVQSALNGRPEALTIAQGLSYFGEHSIGWLAASALGAVLSRGGAGIGWSPAPAPSPPTRRRYWSNGWSGANAPIIRPSP